MSSTLPVTLPVYLLGVSDGRATIYRRYDDKSYQRLWDGKFASFEDPIHWTKLEDRLWQADSLAEAQRLGKAYEERAETIRRERKAEIAASRQRRDELQAMISAAYKRHMAAYEAEVAELKRRHVLASHHQPHHNKHERWDAYLKNRRVVGDEASVQIEAELGVRRIDEELRAARDEIAAKVKAGIRRQIVRAAISPDPGRGSSGPSAS